MSDRYYVKQDYTEIPILSFDVSGYLRETEVNDKSLSKDKCIKTICNEDRNDIDYIIANLYNDTNSNKIKRTCQNIDNLGNMIINNNIEAKTVPIALRKRLLVQRMVS